MRAALARCPGISERAMFGGFCWMLNGNMLCGVEVGRFMFRVGKELETRALAKPGARPTVFDGRRMGGLVWADEAPAGPCAHKLDRARLAIRRRAAAAVASCGAAG